MGWPTTHRKSTCALFQTWGAHEALLSFFQTLSVPRQGCWGLAPGSTPPSKRPAWPMQCLFDGELLQPSHAW